MRLNRVHVLRREQRTNNSYRMLCFESFVFTCLTCKNVQRFRNGPVHEFYGLKASQMRKVRASSHEYPHIEKSRIFGNRNSKVRWPTTVTAKELTSRQKNNLTAKRKTTTSRQKKWELKCPLSIEEILPWVFFFLPWGFLFLWVFFFLPWGFSFCRESFSLCHEGILFAVSLSFCREVFLFAESLMLLPLQLWATVLRWGKQQAIG